jgi:hypothetical protein
MPNLNIKIKSITEAKKGDLLYFDGKEWIPVSIENIFKEITDKLQSNQDELESVKITLKNTVEQVEKEINDQRKNVAELLKGIVK